MARILFGELTRKDLSKKMDTGEEFRILSFDFSFSLEFRFLASNAPMIASSILN